MIKEYLKCLLISPRSASVLSAAGYSMLPLLQGELVTKRHWLSEEELTDYFALAQCQPGPLAINISVLISAQRYGAWGGLCGALGMTLPSFLVILILAMLMENFAFDTYCRTRSQWDQSRCSCTGDVFHLQYG